MIRPALAIALLAAALSAQTVKTLISNGPTSNRYDVVILGDGYTVAEQSKFDADCVKFTGDLFRKEPYRTFAGYFNVHTVFRASNQSGADHPDVNPPIYKDTAYDASYNTGGTPRCLYIGNTSRALSDAARAPATEGRVLVLVNDSRYGGCGGTFAVSYNGSSMSEVQIHEMGHSVGQLADEYDYPNSTYTGSEPREVNATTSITGQKWSIWHGTNGVLAFEGCRYYAKGLFRPRTDCLLRSLGQPHCPICAEALVLKAHEKASAIDNPSPPASSITLLKPNAQAFTFTDNAPASSNATVAWKVDGATAQSGGTSFILVSTPLTTGRHTVAVELVDHTAMVRRDPTGLLTQTHTWSVDVQDPTKPDLTIASVTPTPAWTTAGSSISIDTVVKNAGPAASPGYTVEHFLSTDPVIDRTDIFLGGYSAPALGGGQSQQTVRQNVLVPRFVPLGTYFLGAVVDRIGAIAESDETNNTGVAVMLLGRPSCGAVLEFRDELLYPKDAAVHSMGSGPAVLPTVTSSCDAGQPYLIVWGCSGTAPGTPLAAGLTLPLNLDACTALSIWLQNTPIFGGFFGTLDGNGVGHASFDLAGAPYAGDIVGHFAAAVLDTGLTTFTAVTNPVSIRVVK